MTTEAHGTVGVVEPISGKAPRPVWSVMIPTFNCASLLRETLQSVLAQDPGAEQMQIEVVDDRSTRDAPRAVVEEMGSGRVSFFEQPKNLGPTGNFNTCLQRARGELVHILHGDDYVLPGFYRTVEERAHHRPDLALFHVRSLVVDGTGALETISPRTPALEEGGRDTSTFYYDNPFRTPGAVVRRSFYEQHGGFDERLVHVADWEMWCRAVSLGGGLSINQALSAYRYFPLNHTGQLMRSGENLRDYLRMAELWTARRLDGFSPTRFKAMVAERAWSQARDYQERGDGEAALANRRLWRALASPRQKARRVLKTLFA